MRRGSIGLHAALALLAVAACKSTKDERRSAKAVATPDARPLAAGALGPVARDFAVVEYAVYFLPAPKVPAADEAKAVLARHPRLHVVPKPTRDGPRPTACVLSPPIASYAPPDADRTALFGVGLSAAERAALPSSPEVLVLIFTADPDDAVATNREAMAVVDELTARTGGVVWDEGTRQAFGPDAWRERATRAGATPPDVAAVTVSHAYQPEGQQLGRVVSLGMVKLALPDLVIEDVPPGFGAADDLLALVAQELAEGATPDAQGQLAVDVGAVRSEPARARLGTAGRGGHAATIELHVATPKEGDAKNRLWEIGFPGTGPLHERQRAVLDAVFGTDDQILQAAPDDRALLAASERARAALKKLEPRVVAGLGEREQLSVKAPFTTDGGGTEYMWIEVHGWSGGELRGILLNEPEQVSHLRAGATVTVAEADVFDYRLVHADGTTEGDETTRILQGR